MPSQQIFLDILHRSGQFRYYLEHRALADVAVGVAVLIYVYQVVTPFPGILRIDASPLHRLGIEQHGVSAARLHDERLVRADFVQIGFADVFIILHPSGSQIEIALWVLRNELLDDFAVFGIVRETSLCQVSLSDGTVASQMTMTV